MLDHWLGVYLVLVSASNRGFRSEKPKTHAGRNSNSERRRHRNFMTVGGCWWSCSVPERECVCVGDRGGPTDCCQYSVLRIHGLCSRRLFERF